jgi:hypothetical protein
MRILSPEEWSKLIAEIPPRWKLLARVKALNLQAIALPTIFDPAMNELHWNGREKENSVLPRGMYERLGRHLWYKHCPRTLRQLLRPPDRCRGLAGEDHTQGSGPLSVIFVRREDARREEDARSALEEGGHRAVVGTCPSVRGSEGRAIARRGSRPAVSRFPLVARPGPAAGVRCCIRAERTPAGHDGRMASHGSHSYRIIVRPSASARCRRSATASVPGRQVTRIVLVSLVQLLHELPGQAYPARTFPCWHPATLRDRDNTAPAIRQPHFVHCW